MALADANGPPVQVLVRHHDIFSTGIIQISHVIFRRRIAANIAKPATCGAKNGEVRCRTNSKC
jgi:hypothetical protein